MVTNAELWWNRPSWLRDPEAWPENPATEKTKTSEEEAQIIKEVLSLAKNTGKEEKNRSSSVMTYVKLYAFKLGCDASVPTTSARVNWFV